MVLKSIQGYTIAPFFKNAKPNTMQESILNISVSAFQDYNTPSEPLPVNLIQWLMSDKYAAKVSIIRAETDKVAREAAKAKLPAITPSGLFSYRSERCLISHSGFIQFDIDFKENSHISNYANLKTEICKILNVAYCGLSVSGTGFWGLIPIAYPDKHRQHFDFIFHAFRDIGIIVDRKPRNVAALRGYSYDANAYYNHQALPLTQYNKTLQKASKTPVYTKKDHSTQCQVETLINEIFKKGIDITDTYDDWLNIGFAFAHQFAEAGRGYFHDVSGMHAGYNPKETDEQFKNCIKSYPSTKPITIKTFFARCRDAGILLPKAHWQKKFNRKQHQFNNIQDILPEIILSNDIINCLGETHTGGEFNQLIIAGIKTSNGKVYDLLFDSNGELVVPGEQPEAVQRLATFFEKTLIPALLDDSPCWVNIDRRFIVNNN